MNTTSTAAETTATTKNAESPLALRQRLEHWLVVRRVEGIADEYLVTANVRSYAEAMFDAARETHPVRRAHVALYTRDYAATNGMAGLRRDGLIMDESIEIIADAPVIARVDPEQERHPLLLLAAYAGAVDACVTTEHERRLRVTADQATWYVADRLGNERVRSTLGSWYQAGAEIRAHRDAIAAADDRAHRARIEAMGPRTSAQAVASAQRLELALYAARREAAEFALAGLVAAGLL